ncbi:transferrin-binding protein-like solute binding protein [Novosphingobium pituita]|uniref:Transferrin-binding protein B C-lobe/N-lobe beta-barrel domain-containing protein n=1 Tax=Novosphingobium pituita TaxID=3056842 RepID=A0ABQ6P9M8_9SPHN|nr:transferrin-binding protein-like solute binding protein [Novosphingobium sp. IK01]GMM61580.1 hypothetical protein NUTIK01_23570 [Novosphingobium sp. IK01]
MTKIRRLRFHASLVSVLALAACGGGDGSGGGVNSTPAPPPTGSNASLIGSMVSESFANDSTLATASYAANSGVGTFAAAKGALTFAYDAASKAYSVRDGSLSQTFAPSTLDQTQSSALITTYKVVEGSTSSYLTLTKPGTGSGQTRYVGAGYWQRVNQGSNRINASVESFTYGAQTAAATMPTSGNVRFAVSLVGVRATGQTILGLGGTGQVQVDFTSGALIVRIPYGQMNVQTGQTDFSDTLTGTAMIKSGSSAFSGNLGLSSNTKDNGLDGHFYGPNAAEIGATFYRASPGDVTTGAFFGARDATAPTPSSIEGSGFFAVQSTGLAASLNANSMVEQLAASPALASVYTHSSLQRTFFRADGTTITTGLMVMSPPIYGEIGMPSSNMASLMWQRTGASAQVDALLYGIATPASAMPATGAARYSARLSAIALPLGAKPQTAGGTGDLTVDFKSGTLTASGTYAAHDFVNGAPGDFTASGSRQGTWTGTATLAAGSAKINGQFSTRGALAYDGTFDGSFFGAKNTELATTIKAGDKTGGQLLGVMTASSPVDVTGLVQGLAALTQTTDLQGRSVEYIKSQENTSYGASPSYVSLFRYDPATGTYTINTSPNSVVRSYWPSFLTVLATDRSPSQSTAAFDVYKGAEYTTRVLRTGAGNPDIALTYTSFADLTRNDTQPFIVGQAHQYIMFGTRTPGSGVPTTGTATYNGVAYGSGHDGTSGHDASLAGSSTLKANFDTGSLALTLAMAATDMTTGKARALAEQTYAGTIGATPCNPVCDRSDIVLRNTASSRADNIAAGQFNGLSAQEYGVVFRLDTDADTSHFAGVAMGKRN